MIWSSLLGNTLKAEIFRNCSGRVRVAKKKIGSGQVTGTLPGVYKMTFWRIIILMKNSSNFRKKNSPFESIQEKTPLSSLSYKKLLLRAYYIKNFFWGWFQVYFRLILCLCMPYLELIGPFKAYLSFFFFWKKSLFSIKNIIFTHITNIAL